MKKLWPLLIAFAAVAAFQYWDRPATDGSSESVGSESADAIAEAYANQESGVLVSGEGTVSRILGDDSEGDRHQRFIVALNSGQTILVAHNIDLAPRIDSLQEGDTVAFRGEYEWNDKGGVVHWTHHDPQGQHEAGWLKHRGQTYQ